MITRRAVSAPRPAARATVTLVGAAAAFAIGAGTPVSPADQIAVAQRMATGLVHVEVRLRYDGGNPPEGLLGGYACPSCGSYHYYDSGDRLILEERPLVLGGYLVSPTRVVAPDTKVQERFVAGIKVRHGDQRVDAVIVGYGQEQDAMVLELAESLAGAEPLAFDPAREGPYLTVTCTEGNGAWTTAVQPMGASVILRAPGDRFIGVPAASLIVDRHGVPVALAMNPEVPVSDAWKGAVSSWPIIATAQRTARHERLRKVTRNGLLRVALRFRSPKQQDAEANYTMHHQDEEVDTETATERDTVGILVDDRRLIVLENLAPRTTARLERIDVFDGEGNAHPASFEASLADYGALLVALATPRAGVVSFSDAAPESHRYRYLDAVNLRVAGTQRIVHFGHDRISGFEVGWRRHIYPVADATERAFLFDGDGRLVAFPITPRTRISLRDQWMDDEPIMTAACQVAPLFDDLAAHVDANNVPLNEAEESRLAWMGVELQALDRELARANEVAERTRDGETGALVAFVHAGSPAAEAGVEPGMILLRLHVRGEPKPIDVMVKTGHAFDGAFPWEQYDQVTEEFFEHIPRPWSPAENHFTRTLTDLGFGTAYDAEFVAAGVALRKPFVVTRSPPHFDAAPRFKVASLGITVRDLTYEVRHNLQILPGEPGIIVSKVEPGSAASIAGIKPYETITHVGGRAVHSVVAFEAAVAGATELDLSVRRMAKVRQVRMEVEAGREE